MEDVYQLMMRQIFFFAIFFFAVSYANAQLLWQEDFLDEADGDQIGTAAGTPGGTWSTTAASVRRQDMPIANEILLAANTGSEQRWETNNFDISTAGYAIISADVWSAFVESNDYLRLYYKVDGGPEILFYELAGGNSFADLEPATPASAIVSGNSLQVVARFRNNTWFFFPSLYGLDNVTVTPADILYSRRNGTWMDVTGGFGGTGTWSTDRSGTPACGCVPLNDIVAVIQNGHTVTLPASQIAVGASGTPNLAPGAVDVESGGILQYNVDGVTLGIQQGLMRVRSGGTVNSSSGAITGEQVSFNANVGGATLQVDAGGMMSVEDLVLGTNATNLHYLAGGGTLTVTDDILINASTASLTNNFTTSVTIGDDLNFDSDNSTFINNGTFTVTDITATDNGDDDNAVTNASGATLNVGGFTPTDADMDVLNSGTINQSGNFTSINATDTNFDNLSTGVWNWTLTPNTTYDTDMNTVLNCTAAGNIFNYSGTGAQSIIPATYYHLTLSYSGDKLASATLDVNGNLLIQNTAVLSSAANAIDVEGNIDIQNTAVLGNGASSGGVNIGGNWSAVDAASFVEGSRTVNFDGAGAQTISNLSGTETFGGLTLSGSGVKSSSNLVDINGNLSIAGTAQFSVSNDINLSGNWAVTSTNGDPFIEGTQTVTLDGTGAQAISSVLAAGETFNNLSITGSGIVSNTSILDINGNLIIGGSAQLNANNDISLAGNWDVTSSNGDAFDQGTAAELVTFDGSSDQTITHIGGEIFNRVAVAKPGGNLVLNNSITISNGTGTDLTLTQGKIISTATNLITVSDEATSNGGDSDSYVDGPIRKLGEDAFIFPTGNGSFWARIAVTPSGANNTTSFTAQYFDSSAPNATSLSGVARVSTIEYWLLTRSGTVTNTNRVTLYWESGARSKITDITPASNLFVARFDGTNWVTAGTAAIGGTVATGNVQSANITAANINTVTRNYTFGTNMALPDNPLPIELLSFSAQLKNKEVELKWATASETNNDYFTIERATDVEHFEPIITKDGKGTSKELNHYKAVDSSPLYGRSYYRLKQTDFDGKFTYSELRTIDYEGPNFATLTAFPNPVNTPNFTIKIEGLKDATEVPVQILNLQGQKVFEKVIEIKTPGIITEEISRTNFPGPGLYIIKAGETLYLTKKIVIE